jgi:SPFH domain, Band 7 family protein
MKTGGSMAALFFFLVVLMGTGLALLVSNDMSASASHVILVISFIVAIFVAWATKVANQWDRAVVLRLGKFQALRGPGLFFIIPIIDYVPYWIDIRVISTSFKAEKRLPKTPFR